MSYPAVALQLLSQCRSFVLPAQCCCCGRHGLSLCAGCKRRLQALPAAPLRTLLPTPAGPPLRVYSAAVYSGAPQKLLVHFKHGDTPQHAALLAPSLRRTLAAALQELTRRAPQKAEFVVVPLPSRTSRVRQRGYDHLTLLLQHAGLDPARLVPALRPAPGRQGQVGLSAAARRANAARLTLRSRATPRLRGKQIILVDDVCTTGASLLAAQQTLHQAGFTVAAAVTLCVALRRDDPPPPKASCLTPLSQ